MVDTIRLLVEPNSDLLPRAAGGLTATAAPAPKYDSVRVVDLKIFGGSCMRTDPNAECAQTTDQAIDSY